MDSGDSDSNISDTSVELPEPNSQPANETLQDLTGEADDAASPSSLNLTDSNGTPVIRPRPYQEEMVQESLKRNIIVAVSFDCHVGVYYIKADFW